MNFRECQEKVYKSWEPQTSPHICNEVQEKELGKLPNSSLCTRFNQD